MHPVLFRVDGFVLHSEGVLWCLSILVAFLFASRVARQNGWNTQDVLPGLTVVVAAAYMGARAFGALYVWGFSTQAIRELARPGALGFFGGVALGVPALLGYLRWKRLPVADITDALVPLGPVLYAIFRLGCLFNGDDYGAPTSVPWGMSFPHGSPPTPVEVHPTQIYEILLMAPAFAWLWNRRRNGLPPGALTYELFILMGAERFVVEFTRLAEPGPAGLTPAQWMAAVVVAIGTVGRLSVRSRSSPPSE